MINYDCLGNSDEIDCSFPLIGFAILMTFGEEQDDGNNPRMAAKSRP